MRLPYLEHLDISGYDVSALSWDFNISFPRLTHLYLTNINAERVEPHFFKKIPPSLQVLHLENNRFRNLSLNNLMDITAIYLDGNKHLKNIEISSSKLRTLSFSNCSFTELGYIDLKTPYLEKLDMSNNSLESTSYFRFQNYQTLQILLLNNNKFSEIPLLNLQRLTELSLSYNMIKYILPERFLYLISLQKLSLKGNIIENIESNAFSGLTKLKYLDLSANQLRTLSSDFLLPVISLQFSNVGLRKIGQNFISSDSIITLSLDKNEINDISPGAFRKMKNLRHLNLSENRIPTEKFLMLYGNIKLQTLIINNNNDTSTKTLKEYETLQSLEHLHLCSNQMSDIQVPFHVATPNLISLYLSNNSIDSSNVIFDNLPATLNTLHLDRNLIDRVAQNKLKDLHELMMAHNRITQVCNEDCQEKSISLKGAFEMRSLHLSKNLISDISSDAFNDMKNLLHLDLSDNKISDVPKDTFNNTNMMTKLSLANNDLAAVPDVCPMLHLIHLNLSGNHISAILSNTFCSMRHLENLDLSSNIITTIHTRAFLQLTNLKYLDLSRNRLTQLPARWVSPWNIQELHLEQNKFTNLEDVSLIDIKSVLNVYLEGNPMVMFKAAYFHSLPGHLMVHIKNVHINDNCASCPCESSEEKKDDDDDNDNDSNNANANNGGFEKFFG
ncbi:Insulin-like growth factor-binding protein complex acid labile subunit [Ooceraea biroi]|uniref:Insulin-like growth factor-binding protein complex acid labile subunit n=1 Tax=Ooceraea biroi TaxID=2015173 RepID=A0A026WIA5_OOCBI|nr:Insulin-like growth factor-binding protein complex acid labile subunit [Ooceraea biroi]